MDQVLLPACEQLAVHSATGECLQGGWPWCACPTILACFACPPACLLACLPAAGCKIFTCGTSPRSPSTTCTNAGCESIRSLVHHVIRKLEHRTAAGPLQAPATWARPIDLGCKCPDCQAVGVSAVELCGHLGAPAMVTRKRPAKQHAPCLLQEFLADPKKRQQRFRLTEKRRYHVTWLVGGRAPTSRVLPCVACAATQMLERFHPCTSCREMGLDLGGVDVRSSIEKSTNPHTLVLTKTRASHERAAKQYLADLAAIKRLCQLLPPGTREQEEGCVWQVVVDAVGQDAVGRDGMSAPRSCPIRGPAWWPSVYRLLLQLMLQRNAVEQARASGGALGRHGASLPDLTLEHTFP